MVAAGTMQPTVTGAAGGGALGRSADEKQRERDLFVDVPALGRRRAPEKVVSFCIAYGVELWLVRWRMDNGEARERWVEWGDLLTEAMQNDAQEKRGDIVYLCWEYDGKEHPWEDVRY